MNVRSLVRIGVLVFFAINQLWLPQAAGAADRATIHGNVTLWVGYARRVLGVPIQLHNTEGMTWEGHTDDNGDYNIVVPAPGEYTLSITYASYCRVHRPSFETRAGEDLRFNFDLLLCVHVETFNGGAGASITPYREDIIPLIGTDSRVIVAYGSRNEGNAETNYAGIRVPRSPGLTLPVTIRIGKYTVQGDSANLDRRRMLVTLTGKIFFAAGADPEAYSKPCAVVSLAQPVLRLLSCGH